MIWYFGRYSSCLGVGCRRVSVHLILLSCTAVLFGGVFLAGGRMPVMLHNASRRNNPRSSRRAVRSILLHAWYVIPRYWYIDAISYQYLTVVYVVCICKPAAAATAEYLLTARASTTVIHTQTRHCCTAVLWYQVHYIDFFHTEQWAML